MTRPAPGGPSDQGIVRKRGEDQPRDKERAQEASRKGKADEPPAE
jgi:general stress protein YciG